jgi:hypothetical protein
MLHEFDAPSDAERAKTGQTLDLLHQDVITV